MNLADEKTHRALAFVAALNESGYHPTEAELDAYVHTRPPTPLSVFDLIDRFSIGSSMFDHADRDMVRRYLIDSLWLRLVDRRLAVTELGLHVLSALEATATLGEGSIEIALDPDDPIVLSRVVKSLSEIGAAMLVDPYFRLEMLPAILYHTEINRILLTDSVKESDRNGLKHAVATPLQIGRRVELRVAAKAEIHDRYVIPAHAATVVRKLYEGVWKKAQVLGVAEGSLGVRTEDSASEADA